MTIQANFCNACGSPWPPQAIVCPRCGGRHWVPAAGPPSRGAAPVVAHQPYPPHGGYPAPQPAPHGGWPGAYGGAPSPGQGYPPPQPPAPGYPASAGYGPPSLGGPPQHAYAPPPTAQGYPPPYASHGYPPPHPGQGYPPPHSGQGYAPTHPSQGPYAQQPPAAGHGYHQQPDPAAQQQYLAQLRQQTAAAEQRLAALQRDLQSVEEAIGLQSFGVYTPRYGFESSEDYVARLKIIRDQQKAMIKAGQATHCDTKWTKDGNAAEGQKMVDQQSRLMLRAFNGEADAAIAKVKYDNVVALEQRITKACEEINKCGHATRVCVTRPYYELKLAELRLVHEHREKVQQEKEEQRRIKEQMREEQRAQAEIDRAKEEAEREEAQRQKALEKARAELAEATGKQHEKLEGLVTRLENELKEALDRKAKAIARAQLTKSGHVYVLSNVGSFGQGVFKIGMTRRLEPLERVDELGDASVPFPFDVHAMIYSADAPALESALHRQFTDRRVNLANMRKEYFRVTLDEVRDAVAKLHHGIVTFVVSVEAEEYRKTCAVLEAKKTGATDQAPGAGESVVASVPGVLPAP